MPDRIACGWCHGQNDLGRKSCAMCGAPLDVADLVTESGWRTVPKVRDATRFGFSTSTCEVEGEIVPVISIALGAGESGLVTTENATLEAKQRSVEDNLPT